MYGNIVLPRPEVESSSYDEQLGSLIDVLDEIINSMLAKLELSTADLELDNDINIKDEEKKNQGKCRNRKQRRREREQKRFNTKDN
jgi:hypothetical protein